MIKNLYKIFMLNIPFTHLRFESKGIHFYRSYLPDDGKTAVLNLVRKGLQVIKLTSCLPMVGGSIRVG
jgi:hypothetical protein